MPDDEKVDETPDEQAPEQIEQRDTEVETPQEPQSDHVMPEPEMSVIISSLATQALIGLGVMTHPVSNKKETDLVSAKFSIDLLSVLEEKTKGNLADIEKRFIETILHDLRMKFVEASNE